MADCERHSLDGLGPVVLVELHARGELDILQPDPLLSDDGDDIVPADHLLALARDLVDAQLDVWHAGEEAEEEEPHSSDLSVHVAIHVLLDVELVHGRNLNLLLLVRERAVAVSRQLEQGLLDHDGELLHVLVALRADLEQL